MKKVDGKVKKEKRWREQERLVEAQTAEGKDKGRIRQRGVREGVKGRGKKEINKEWKKSERGDRNMI